MISIIKQEIDIKESLKKKIEFVCEFCKTTPTFIKENVRKIKKHSESIQNNLNNFDKEKKKTILGLCDLNCLLYFIRIR